MEQKAAEEFDSVDEGGFAKEESGTSSAESPTDVLAHGRSLDPVAKLFSACLEKLFNRLEAKPRDKLGSPMVLLVMTGSFNPIHIGHMRALEAAAAHCQNELHMEVAGAVLSLSHDTVVRNRYKRRPAEAIPGRHRLKLCQEMSKRYAWVTVDQWEVTRRAALEYLSVLEHIQSVWHEATFVGGRGGPQVSEVSTKVIYVCDLGDLIRSSPVALKAAGFDCLTVCRPEELRKTQRTIERINPPWKGVVSVAEDYEMIHADQQQLLDSGNAVRHVLMSCTAPASALEDDPRTSTVAREARKQRKALEQALGVATSYAITQRIGPKMCAKEPWSKRDHAWGSEQQAWMEATYRWEDKIDECESGHKHGGDFGGGGTLRMASYDRKDPLP